jgi:hypothetical protein
MVALERVERGSDLGLTPRAVVTLGLPRGVLKTDQGLDRSRITPNLAVCGRNSPIRNSVPACPGLPFVDALTAQFAALVD